MAGQIAQLMVPADGAHLPRLIVPDWPRGRIYFVSETALRSYQAILETQSPLFSSLAYTSSILGADVDPVSGALLVNRPEEGNPIYNGDPLYKYDPNTFAIIGSFGATAIGLPSWPTSFWAVEVLVCVECGTLASGGATQVGYAFLKSVSNGNLGVVRTDTMQQAGFYQIVVSGSTGGRGFMCRAASGAAGASVFLSWNTNTAASPAIPLYKATISPGAELYNPASWPATNSHIESHTVGTITATSVDPAWSNLQCVSLGYDPADGNVLMVVVTNDAVTNRRYLIKVNATTAAVIWATVLPVAATLEDPGLPGYSIAHNTIGLIGAPEFGLVATNTGALTTSAFGGLTWGTFLFGVGGQLSVGSIASDTAALYFVSAAAYNSASPNAPTPVAGTPGTFSNGYALIGGLIPPPSGGGGNGGGGGTLRLAMDNVSVTAQTTLLPKNLISLRWSDDRGHAWGHPVAIPMGEAGEYRTSLQWQRLSFARDRVFELSWSVPCRTALQGAWIDVTPAQS